MSLPGNVKPGINCGCTGAAMGTDMFFPLELSVITTKFSFTTRTCAWNVRKSDTSPYKSVMRTMMHNGGTRFVPTVGRSNSDQPMGRETLSPFA